MKLQIEFVREDDKVKLFKIFTIKKVKETESKNFKTTIYELPMSKDLEDHIAMKSLSDQATKLEKQLNDIHKKDAKEVGIIEKDNPIDVHAVFNNKEITKLEIKVTRFANVDLIEKLKIK